MKKWIAFLLCCVLCTVALSSCKNKDNSNPHQEQSLSDSSDHEINPQSGGRITIYCPRPDSLCPIRTQNSQTISMLNLIYDSLITTSSSMTAVPNLASSWSVSDNGLKWNIKLRSDVSWHDNSAFTAADVVYTINQIRIDKSNYYKKNVEQISKIKAANQHEVEIQLTAAQTNFINLLSFPIIKEQRGTVDKSAFNVIGTGAFKFTDKGEVMSYYLVRNENWWKKNAYLDEIHVKILPDKDTALYSFSSGEIDLISANSSDLGSKVNTTNAGFITYPTNKFHFLGFCNTHPILKNKEVRKAIALAINRKQIVSDILRTNARPASVPLDTTWELYSDKSQDIEANTTMAKEVLEADGWINKDGFYHKKIGSKDVKLEFELLLNESNSVRAQVGAYLTDALRNIGINLTVKSVSFDDYNKLINRKQYDMFLGAFDISENLDYRFMLGKNNIFGYNSSEMNNLLNEIQKSVTNADRKEKYEKLQVLFCEDVPLTGLYFENSFLLYNKRMNGSFSPKDNNIYNGFEDIFVLD